MKFNEENMPKHIAIIMDGNRRWARTQGKPASFGHKAGAKTLENIVRYANKIGLKYITVYAFSTENWKRTEEEVKALMLLLQSYLDDYSKRADSENIKVKVLGDITALSQGMQKSIINCMERTKNNTGITFNIALNYGGRDEIVRAVKKIAQKVEDKKLKVEDISDFEKYKPWDSEELKNLANFYLQIKILNILLAKVENYLNVFLHLFL